MKSVYNCFFIPTSARMYGAERWWVSFGGKAQWIAAFPYKSHRCTNMKGH